MDKVLRNESIFGPEAKYVHRLSMSDFKENACDGVDCIQLVQN